MSDTKIKNEPTDSEGVPLSRLVLPLDWKEGPAREGDGTAGKSPDGHHPLWYDGECLFVIVETSNGHEYSIITVSADEEHLAFYHHDSGESWDAWSDRDISWWAKIESGQLPENSNIEAS